METLRSPFHKDIPKAFKFPNSKGKEVLVGSYAKLVQCFADYMNYTLILENVNEGKMSEIQRNIEKNVYNISLISTTYDNRFADIDFSYPLDWSNTCVMVPSKDELPRYWYIAWPFGRYIWSFLGISVIYVAYLMSVLKHPRQTFQMNLLYSMSLVLYCPNACCVPIKNLSLRLQLFYGLLIMMGFIFSGYYNSYLTAYNMRPVFQTSIKNIDDALEANIDVLISSITLEELKNNRYVNLARITKLLKETTALDITEKIRKINRSFAYVITRTHWNFVSKLQKNLIQPVFQLSEICFGPVLNTYPIQENAKFAQTLDMFIMRVKECGLWTRWNEEGFLFAISKESYRLLEDEYPVEPLNLYYFRIGWIVLIGGLILSLICFVLELVIFKYQLRFTINFWRFKIRRV